MSATPAFELDDVRFAYPGESFRLRVDHLAVARGECVACVGPSGSGKTTLVNLIAGILAPSSGTVKLLGEPISSLPDAERRARRIKSIGMVFQEFALLDYLSTFENILVPYHVSPALKLNSDVRERAGSLAEATGVTHTLKRKPQFLSQGERQRVALCRALVTEPAILLCDEPTGNLDPDTARISLDLVFEQVRSRGATLFMVTHDYALLERFERVIDVRELVERAVPGGST